MPGPTPTSTHSQRQHKFRRPSRLRHNTASAASTSATSGDLDHAPVMSQHQCCGVVEEAALQAREKRANRTTPQPWIVRKLAVFLTLGIMGYAGYVYIGRFCISAINRTGQSATGRPTAIVLLPIFCVLYLWMIWAYIKVILTSPGYAKDYEPQCPQPGFDQPDTRHSDYDLENSLTHYNAGLDLPKSSHEFDPTRTHRYNKPSYSSTSSHHPARGDRVQPPEPIAGPSYEDIVLRTSIQGRSVSLERLRQTTNHEDARASGATLPEEVDDGGVGEGRLRTPFEPPFTIFLPEDHEHSQGETTSQRDGQTLEMGTLGGREPRNNRPQAPAREVPPLATTPEKSRHDKSSWKALFFPCAAFYGKQRVAPREKREITVRRRPPTIPILHPAHRYCFRDQIVKPYRAHHCRNCGTCVLKFDHHCPWIGQCVGARNHKFFLNFCLAAMIFTLYVLGTLVGFNVSAWVSTSSTSHVDSQVIVISSLALLFSLFTSVLTWTHIILIMRGQTTVESMTIHSMKEREGAELTREYGICSFSVKREARKQWNEEWGDLDSEGNIWWTGSKKQGWIDVMGSNPLGWIFPIGRGKGDGLSYAVNPRFDEQGRLRRRAEWPAELR